MAGAAGSLVVILGAAFARGTSPWGVFFAMYPFRVRATEAMQHLPSAERTAHLTKMLEMWGVTGAPLVICGFIALVLLRRTPIGPFAGPLAFAILVLAVYDAGSIFAGGSYWSHYVLQLVVPTALMAGLMLASVPWAGRAVAVGVLALCTLGWVVGTTARVPAAGATIGAAIKDAAQPDDTMLSLLGDGAMVQTSGLSAPYTYLWSLPAHVLDHHFARLTAVLKGPEAPSWVVVRDSPSTHLMQKQGPGAVLHHRYRRVATMCGRAVFLRDDLSRTVPEAAEKCSMPLVAWRGDAATHHWTVTEGSQSMEPASHRTLIVVPTYDEIENIDDLIDAVLAAVPDAHVLVVDDNSPDGTGDLVAARTDLGRRVHLMRRPGKAGLGAAYRAGLHLGAGPRLRPRRADGRRLLAPARERARAARRARGRRPRGGLALRARRQRRELVVVAGG